MWMEDYTVEMHLKSVTERLEIEGNTAAPPSGEEMQALFTAVEALWSRRLSEEESNED